MIAGGTLGVETTIPTMGVVFGGAGGTETITVAFATWVTTVKPAPGVLAKVGVAVLVGVFVLAGVKVGVGVPVGV